jgi:hypothetical protein
MGGKERTKRVFSCKLVLRGVSPPPVLGLAAADVLHEFSESCELIYPVSLKGILNRFHSPLYSYIQIRDETGITGSN